MNTTHHGSIVAALGQQFQGKVSRELIRNALWQDRFQTEEGDGMEIQREDEWIEAE